MTIVKFADIVHLITTRAADPASAGIDRFVGLEHIEPENLHIRNWGNVADGTTFTNTFKRGQVLFGKRRAYQRKVAVADFDGVCSGDIYVFESKDPNVLLPELVPFILQSEGFYQYAVKTSAGSLSPRTNWTHLANYELNLPPVDEQRKIAELLNAFEESITSHMELVRQVKINIRSALNNAFHLNNSGHRIIDVPQGWQMSTIEELSDKTRPISYGILIPGKPVDNGIPMLRVMDFDEFGRRTETEILKVSKKVADTSKTTYLTSGDVVVSVVATIGRSFVIPDEMDGWNLNRALAVIPCSNLEIATYLNAFFQSGFMQRFFEIEKIGSAQPRINLNFLKNAHIPVAPAEIRAEINSLWHRLMDAFWSAESHLSSTRKLKKEILNRHLR